MNIENEVKKYIKKNPWAKDHDKLVRASFLVYNDLITLQGNDFNTMKTRKAIADSYKRIYDSLLQKKPEEKEIEDFDDDLENPSGD